MTILADKYDSAVVVDRYDHGTAAMMDHLALVRQLTFRHCVDGDFEYAAVKNLLAAEYLW
jgi:hypothetical protein